MAIQRNAKLSELKDFFIWASVPWLNQSACRNAKYRPGWWYRQGIKRSDELIRERAKAICSMECPVRWRCLARYIEEEHGIYGGLDEEERKKLRGATYIDLWHNPEVLRCKVMKVAVTNESRVTVELRVS